MGVDRVVLKWAEWAEKKNGGSAAGGTIFAKSPGQAYEFLEEMTINSYQWPSERAGLKQSAGVYAVDSITFLASKCLPLPPNLHR